MEQEVFGQIKTIQFVRIASPVQSSSILISTNGSGNSINITSRENCLKMNNHFTRVRLPSPFQHKYNNTIKRCSHSMNLLFSGEGAKRVLRFSYINFCIRAYINGFLFNVSQRAWNRVNFFSFLLLLSLFHLCLHANWVFSALSLFYILSLIFEK